MCLHVLIQYDYISRWADSTCCSIQSFLLASPQERLLNTFSSALKSDVSCMLERDMHGSTHEYLFMLLCIVSQGKGGCASLCEYHANAL